MLVKNKVMVYCCQNSAWKAIENARLDNLALPENVKITRVPCLERLNIGMILKTVEAGAQGIFLVGCLSGSCSNLNGNERARVRVAEVKNLLNKNGFSRVRIEYYSMKGESGHGLVNLIQSFVNGADLTEN